MPTAPTRRTDPFGDHVAAQEADLARALVRVRKTIDGRIADALAHARNVLTDTLRDATEGRPTAAKVRRSRSYRAAVKRLAELVGELVGLIESFRVESYARSWAFYRATLPADALRDAPGGNPAKRRVERTRTVMIHGVALRVALANKVGPYGAALVRSLTVAGNRGTPRTDARDVLTRWADGARSTILAAARAHLIDGQTMADRLAGRDAIRPELLHDDPSLPESA